MITRKFSLLSFCLSMIIYCFGQNAPCGYEYVQGRLMQSNPEYELEVKQYLNQVLPEIQQSSSSRALPAVITIPVVVHVIHTGQSIGNGANLSTDRINSQIDILNQDYRRENTDASETPSTYQDIAADTEIQFCLAKIDPLGAITNGITRHVYSNVPDIDYIENTIKPATTWDADLYLNIWTIAMPNSSILGYSYLPTITIVGSNRDGVVINYPNFGYINTNNKGRTCIHEVGHYLGLQHIWGASDSNGDPIGCTSDDGVSDTPTSSGPHYGCPNFGSTSCNTIDMVMNYMEYVNDDCMNLFTEGQKTVMHNTLSGLRASLANSASTNCAEIDLGCRDLSTSSIIMGFESDQPLNGWEIENTNNDTRTWLVTQNTTNDWGPNSGEGLAVYLWNVNGTTPADDYLFTPCFEIKEDHTYKLTFSYACAADNNVVYNEAFEVGFSEEQSSDDFNVSNDNWIFEEVDNSYPTYNTATFNFTANADEFTSLGFHVFSAPDRYALQIDDIKIEDLGLLEPVSNTVENNTLQLMPNPTNGDLNLKMDFSTIQKSVKIQVFDVLGRIVIEKELFNVLQNRSKLDLSHLEEGIYFVNVKSKDILLTKKVLLNR